MQPMDGSAPPGMQDMVERMKQHQDITNPFALAWYMYHKQQKGGANDHSPVLAPTDADLDAAVREYESQRLAGTLLAEVELAASGVPWAQAVLLGQAMAQPFRLYREMR